jgi:MFS family permease
MTHIDPPLQRPDVLPAVHLPPAGQAPWTAATAAPEAELDGGSRPDPECLRRTSRRLWVIYPLAMLALFSVLDGVTQVLLGKQIAALRPDGTAAAATLGTVLTVAAASGALAQPILGRLSDRTRIRFLGRRNVWIFGAGIVGALGLIAMPLLTSTLMIAVAWAVLMWPMTGAQVALTTVLPERVPARERGTMAGLVTAAAFVGAFAGVALAGLAHDVFRGYLLLAAVLLVFTQIFAWTTTDRPAPDLSTLSKAQRKAATKLPGLRAYPDFWWAFAGRFLVIFGCFSMYSFQLFILKDHVGIGDINKAATTLVAISGLSAVMSLAFSVLGGWISDRLGHLRLFVGLSTLMFVPVGLVYLLSPTLTGAWIAMAIMGAAAGSYLAVSQALVTRILPNIDNAGRDLGIFNMSNTGAQIIAPGAAGAVVGATGSYTCVFILLIVSTALSAASVHRIKGVP